MDKQFGLNKKLYFCFVDFNRAYNSIQKEAFFTKLFRHGISRSVVSLLQGMCSRTKLSVQLSDGISEFFNSSIGLKHGCNMRPVLFNLCINDSNSIFSESCCQLAWIGSIVINCQFIPMTYSQCLKPFRPPKQTGQITIIL